MRSSKPVIRDIKSGKKPSSLRRRLALTTALATVAFGYGGRAAYAGICTASGGGVYSCSGAAGSGSPDVRNGGAALPPFSNVSNLQVSTVSGFGHSTGSDNAFRISGDGGLTFTDNNNSSITGATSGIRAYNINTGATTITTTGTVIGNQFVGIRAINNDSGVTDLTTDLTISVATVSGATYGIQAENRGIGFIDITATGAVTSTGTFGDGIEAELSVLGPNPGANYGTDLTISAAAVTGQTVGIDARSKGTGALSITATGTVAGGTQQGIFANNFGSGTNVEIDAVSVTGGSTGISASNSGTGFLSVTTTGSVTGDSGAGIRATTSNASGTTLTISADDVSGTDDGIYANHAGTGTQTVTVTGTVTGGSLSGNSGIDTRTGSGGTTNITLNFGAAVSATSGTAILNDAGNSTTTVNAGASVAGAISLGDGADNLIFNNGGFSGVTSFDGGAGTDSVTFRNATATVAGGDVVNMENVTVGSGGNISVSGALDANVTVNSNGTFGGAPTITGNVTVDAGGTLSPGNSPGLLSIVGNLDLGITSNTLIEIGGLVAGTEYDQIDVADNPVSPGTIEGIATLAAGAIFDVNFFVPFNNTLGDVGLGDIFDILVADSISADINSLTFDFFNAQLASGLDWDTSIVTISGGANDGREALRLTVLEGESITLPEPAALPLFAAGLLGLLGLVRRHNRRWRRG